MPCQVVRLVPEPRACWEPLAAGYTQLHSVHSSSPLCAHPQHMWKKVHKSGVSPRFFFPKKEKLLSLIRVKSPHIIRLCIATRSEGCSRAGTHPVPQPQAAPVTPRAHGQWHLTQFLLWAEQNLLRGETSADPGYKGWPVPACGQRERAFSSSFHVT